MDVRGKAVRSGEVNLGRRPAVLLLVHCHSTDLAKQKAGRDWLHIPPEKIMRSLLLFLLGVPIPVIIVIAALFH